MTPAELAVVATALRPARLYPLRPHAEQHRLRDSKARFKVVPAGRRSGKTERAKRRLARAAFSPSRWDDPRYFAAAPTRDQAKAIYWADLKSMIPRALTLEVRESDLMIRMAHGAELWVIGMDKPERIEGRPWDGGILDEFANMKPGAWGENVRPALSDRKGWCWLIGVPEGRNHYYDINEYALHAGDPEWDSFSWPSADILDPDEVAAARRQLEPTIFEQEYEASFVNFTGRAYYPFLDKTHARQALAYNSRGTLIFCFDFNVDPGVAVVAQEQPLPGQFERDENGLLDLSRPVIGTGVIGQVHIPQNSNTPAVVARLIKDWGTHQGRVECYGDASGGNRGTAKLAGSDWDLIKRDLRAHFGDRVTIKVPAANGPERSRVNAVNSRLVSGDLGAQTIRLMVDGKKAPDVVKCFEGTRVLEGGSGEINKKATPKLTHWTDALGYYVVQRFPIVSRAAVQTPLRM